MHSPFRHILWRTAIMALIALCGVQSLWAQGYMVSGKVRRAADQKPLVATVCLYSTSSLNANDFAPRDKVMCDAQGNFVFTMTSAAEVKLLAYPNTNSDLPTYYPSALDLQSAQAVVVTQNVSNLTIDVQAAKVYDNGIKGRVVDTKGNGIAGMVYIISAGSPNSMTAGTSCDAKGNFSISNLKPGNYIIEAMPTNSSKVGGYYRLNDVASKDASLGTVITVKESGFVSPDPLVVLDINSVTEQDFNVKGLVIDNISGTVAGAVIELSDANGAVVPTKSPIVSASDGSFSFSLHCMPCVLSLKSTASGYLKGSTVVLLEDGVSDVAVKVRMVKMQPTYDNAIRGVVQDLNKSAVFATITASIVDKNGKPSPNTLSYSIPNDPKTGEFNLTSIEPGVYTLYASPNDDSYSGGYYELGTVAVPDMMKATQITVADKGSNTTPYIITLDKNHTPTSYDFYVMVVDENDQPLEGVSFTAVDAKGNNVLVNQNVLTDQGGFVHLVFPGAGTYVLTATKDGYADGTGTISFSNSMWAQKAYVRMVKINGTKGQSGAQIIAGVDMDENAVESLNPQPANEVLNISLANTRTADHVEIYALDGQRVQSLNINATSTVHLDLSTLTPGSYNLRLFSQGRCFTTKFFIKN